MASPAAQAFFDKQSPKDRMAIIDSWGGADLTDEWFKNAQAAGSAPAAGAAAPAAGAAPAGAAPPPGLMDFNTWFAEGNKEKGDWRDNAQSRQAYQAYVYNASNPGQTGSAEDAQGRGGYGQSGDPSGMRAYARANGLSEDFNRFDNATLTSWEAQKSSGCPANAPYQAYDGSGCVEKPIDSAEGAGGGDGGGGQGRGGGAPGAAGAAGGAKPAGYFGQDDPLQRMLTNQMATGAGTFGGTQTGGQFAGGGVFSQGSGQRGAPLTGAAVAAPVPAAPAVNPAASALTAFSGGGGSALAPKQENAVVGAGGIAPLGTSGFENAVSGAGSIAPLGMPNANAVVGAGSIAPLGKQPDAFGVAPGSGSFEDLIDPRRKKQDARLGGSWF